jgi:hypothetical protein
VSRSSTATRASISRASSSSTRLASTARCSAVASINLPIDTSREVDHAGAVGHLRDAEWAIVPVKAREAGSVLALLLLIGFAAPPPISLCAAVLVAD